MLNKMDIIQKRLLTISNTIAKNPPTGLKKYDWQALIILSTVIDQGRTPVYGIDDIQDMMKNEGITNKAEQRQFLDDFMLQQDTYVLSFDEFFSYYTDRDSLNRTIKKDILKAVEALHNRNLHTNNTEDAFRGITWFDTVEVNYKENYIMFILGRIAKKLLMGLDKNFLQMMATSVTEFSGKYSTPIFMYMKSKLHKGTEAYSWTEALPVFQHRFGHDDIVSYTKDYNSYYKRVLRTAEKDSLGSGDIAFKFEGKAKRGRKITEIYCKVWRTGNIYLPKKRLGKKGQSKMDERKKQWLQLEKKMTVQQRRAYEYLKSLDINHGFLLEEVCFHPSLQHEMIKAYEDIFLQMLWKRFLFYTKAKKPAGAFVSWWRRGRLTSGDHYWATVEALNNKKKGVAEEKLDERKKMSTMTHEEWHQQQTLDTFSKTEKRKPTINKKKSITPHQLKGIGSIVPQQLKKKEGDFDYKVFKSNYAKEHEQIAAEILSGLEKVYGLNRVGEKDVSKTKEMKKRMLDMLPSYCERWFQENILGKK